LTTQPQPPPAPYAPARQHPTAGIVSLVMGILGLIGLWLIGPILALVFGYQSRNVAAREPQVYSDDLGRVGRILGWIGLALSLFGLLVVVVAAVALVGVRAW
jgi:hypothetical protein